MAGHSKWANIKHRKARADQKKGKIFSRLSKEIISAVKQGGSDPKANAKLKVILIKAKAANLSGETIQRNIKKALSKDQANYQEMIYEIYGHGSIGIIVEGMTDNKNRMASEMRIATNKCGGTIASPGSVSYNFEKKGVIQVPLKSIDEDELFLAVTDSGAEDFEKEENVYIITTKPENLYQLKETLTELDLENEEEIAWIAKTMIKCIREDQEKNLRLIDWLENLDDVDAVYHNMEL